MPRLHLKPLLLSISLLSSPLLAAEVQTIPIQSACSLPPIGSYGRTPVHIDPLEAEIVNGTFEPPNAGSVLALPDGKQLTWKAEVPDKDGAYPLHGGAYLDVVVNSPADEGAILHARGDSMVYVNGAPLPGDIYGNGTLHLPVHLKEGRNDLLFLVGRGPISVNLVSPRAAVSLDTSDLTLPDLHANLPQNVMGALPVLNATGKVQSGCMIEAIPLHGHATYTRLPALLPFEGRKLMFRVATNPAKADINMPVELKLLQNGKVLSSAQISLAVRGKWETYKATFISNIDGSLQYYAVNPAHPLPGARHLPALCLTLHGAGVEAIGQVNAYESKSWLTFVGPTNRRPYGFDWEDWGRLDALEVLKIARHTLPLDLSRTYLAGHSMGGHGTWQIGVLYPDKFAAIGPSAAWIDFQRYIGTKAPANPTPVQSIFERASATSNTLKMGHNYAQEGVYILQGLADDTVPPNEAEYMIKYLGTFSHDFEYHLQPGAGHWWDVSKEPGADCVDWRPMYQFFAHHTLPSYAAMRHINFTTENPGVTAHDDWLTIWQQIKALEPTNANIIFDPGLRLFHGTTSNLSLLRINLNSIIQPDLPVNIELDGNTSFSVAWPKSGILWLEHVGNSWITAPAPLSEFKSPARSGPFKLAFTHRFCLVYGTHGTPQENKWAYDKARFDAETFWYRGNGSVEIKPDTQYNPDQDKNQSVILYGNSETNSMWKVLLPNSPIKVSNGTILVGHHVFDGSNLACLFLRPRAGSSTAYIGAVSGSGLEGMKLTDRLPVFMSGVGWPDCTVMSSNVLVNGDEGVLAAGFFGNDWKVSSGDFAFAPPPVTKP